MTLHRTGIFLVILVSWVGLVRCLKQDPDLVFNRASFGYETHLSENDFRRGAYVIEQAPDSKEIEESLEKAGLFEGDINLANRSLSQYAGPDPTTLAVLSARGVHFNAIKSAYEKWSGTDIPYTISSRYSSYSRSRIAAAMDEYAKLTCIRFVPRQSENDYVYIAPDNGCYSMVGRLGGQQIVSLDAGCIAKGIIMHELMHVVGFFHEQSRADRDQYVDIKWPNIMTGMTGQFRKFTLKEIDHLDIPYDYGSIMHYASTAFTKNGQDTIVPKRHGVKIGQRVAFSNNDVRKINKLYKCPQAGLVTAVPNANTHRPKQTTAAALLITSRFRPQGTTIKPSNSKQCGDTRSDCDFLKRLNYCTLYDDWMTRNCGLTCGLCSATDCEDVHQYCGQWSKAKYCDNELFKRYLEANCKKSCDKC